MADLYKFRKAYQDYAIDAQSNGKPAIPFEDWVREQSRLPAAPPITRNNLANIMTQQQFSGGKRPENLEQRNNLLMRRK